jgi:hypothetical protein
MLIFHVDVFRENFSPIFCWHSLPPTPSAAMCPDHRSPKHFPVLIILQAPYKSRNSLLRNILNFYFIPFGSKYFPKNFVFNNF